MVDLLGLHRPDDRDLVSNFADVRKDVGEFLSRLAPALEGVLRAECLEYLTLQLGDLLTLGE